MPGRGQANIGTWPKSSVSSRGLGITWIAKATIGTFCSDFVVRKCLHSLFAATLFFPFSEENINQNGAFFLCSHVINKWHWLVHKNPALRNLHPVAYPAYGHSGHALCLWLWGVHPVCKVRRHDRIWRKRKSTRSQHEPQKPCCGSLHAKKSAVKASYQSVAPTSHQ